MTGWEFYVVVLLVYFATDLMATWGLNLQFGVTGVLNFSFIVDVAVGAYAYAILTLGSPSANGGFQSFIFGATLNPALALLGATAAGALVGGALSLVGLRRLRQDYQAIALLVVSIVASTVVEADQGLFNGNAGLTLIPNPFGGTGPSGNDLAFLGLSFGLLILLFLFVRSVSDSPLGRTLRAVRDDDTAALAVGKNVVGLRILVQVLGGAMAGLSGALLAAFIGAWSPSAWQYVETIALLSAVIVGGAGNNWGVLVGTLLVPVVLQQGAQFLPPIAGHPGLAEYMSWIVLGLLLIAFLWWRPRGIVPERRPSYPVTASASAGPVPEEGAVPAVPRLELRRRTPAEPGTPGHDPILQVEGVHVSYGGVHAVDGVSLTAERGRITGLIGPNGAGKSTLVNVVSGFVIPNHGRVLFDGHDVSRLAPDGRARRGLVRTFQLPRVFPSLTTVENLLLGTTAHGGESVRGVLLGRLAWGREEEEALARATELLSLFGMADMANRPAGSLSGGQKRMLEIMRALMLEPKMLLLDEPLAGLSPRWGEILEAVLVSLRREGLTLVLIEHELGIVERVCDTVVVMAQGRVLSVGTMAELRTRREVQEAYVVG